MQVYCRGLEKVREAGGDCEGRDEGVDEGVDHDATASMPSLRPGPSGLWPRGWPRKPNAPPVLPPVHGGRTTAPRPYIGYVSSQWHTRQPQAPQQLAATSWCRSHACRATERAVSMPRSTEGKTPRKTPESTAPRPYIGYVSSQWHTKQPQAPQQLAAISWCRSHADRATERAVSMPRSTEGKTPRKTPESSTLRPYIGYVSSQWHTRQPQAPKQLAAISWCWSHAYQAT